ncbi:MAG: hypothetical protein KBT01_07290 [Clostridiales bacterium]|nr:hypothetical protein [Candidatus Blautia equi]
MQEVLLLNLTKWGEVFEDGFYQYLLLAAAVFLLFRVKKHKESRILLGYLALGLFFYWFPPTAALIQKFLDKATYWRMLWAIPVLPLIAYAGTTICGKISSAPLRLFAVVLCLGIFAVSGRCVWNADTFQKMSHPYKIQPEILEIARIIKEDAGDERVILAADEAVADYIRVREPSFFMRYGRRAEGYGTKHDRWMYYMLTDPAGRWDGELVIQFAKEGRCNYLVVPVIDVKMQDEYIQANGYAKIGAVGIYCIYHLTEEG